MYDTMTLTKAVAALCGALLLFLLMGWAGESIFSAPHYGVEQQAYRIDTGAEEVAAEEAPADEVPFEEIMAAADAAAGQSVFRQCQACHKLDGANLTGPHLDGVVDRDIAAVDGFAYSDVLAGMDGAWTPETLSDFLAAPRTFAPGTKMIFSGLRNVQDRANLIAFLATTGS